MTPAILERFELIVEIAGRLSRKARKIDVLGAFALSAVTGRGRACKGSRRHGVGRALRFLGKR
jgi:hypothetical protein